MIGLWGQDRQGHAVVPGLEDSACSGPSRQDCGRACETSGGAGRPQQALAAIPHAGGRAAVKTAELCLQVIEACLHERDLGAGSCDVRRTRQAIRRNMLSAPRYSALLSL